MKIYISVALLTQQHSEQHLHVNICASTDLALCKQRIAEYPRHENPSFTIEVWENGFEVDERIAV